jgi:hypothetical protein
VAHLFLLVFNGVEFDGNAGFRDAPFIKGYIFILSSKIIL